MARALTPLPDRLLERVHVIIPELAFLYVGRREFPALLRLVEAVHEALLLLLARHVQEELQNFCPLAGRVVLKMRDVGQPLVPDPLADERRGQLLPLQDFRVHAHDEDFLVVRTVEDADPPALGQVSDVAPHEVMVELLRRGLLERGHLAPLRIDARHDVLDRAVFAGRVHRLEDQQQGPAVLGVEHVLLFRQPRGAALEELRSLALVQLQAAGVTRIEVVQPEALAFGNAERVDVLPYEVANFFSRHGREIRLLSSRPQCQRPCAPTTLRGPLAQPHLLRPMQ